MNKHVLIVDDHQMMIEGYKTTFQNAISNYVFTIETATNLFDAHEKIVSKTNQYCFDLIVLDLSLPVYKELNLESGLDLINPIRKAHTQAKIIVITSHTEYFFITTIVQKYKLESVLIKSDITPKDLLQAIHYVFDNQTYYSKTVKDALQQILKITKNLDEIDLKIIEQLANGIKTKNLVEHIPLTMSSIDKRKAKIKQFFAIEKGTDEDIIRIAKEQNWI